MPEGTAGSLASGEFDVSSHTVSPATLTVRGSADGDPSAGDFTISFSARHAGVTVSWSGGGTRHYATVDGVRTISHTTNNGSIVAHERANIRHCDIYDGTKHSLYYGDGGTIAACVLKDAYFSGANSLGVYNQSDAPGYGVYHFDIAGIQSAGYASGTYVSSFWYGHDNAAGHFNEAIFTRIYGENLGTCLNGTSVDTFKVSNAYYYNCGQSMRITASNSIYLNHTIINDSRLNTAPASFFVGGTQTVLIENCVHTVSGTGTVQNGFLYIAAGNDGANVTIRNLTHNRGNVLLSASTPNATLLFENNTYDMPGGRYYDFGALASLPANFISRTNKLCNVVLNSRFNSTEYDPTEWQAIGQDVDSQIGGC
jgi:hypothetical protein